MRRTVWGACLAMALCPAPALADTATLLQKFKDWSAFSATGTPKVCFAVAQPKTMTPKAAKRGPVFFYVSQWPPEQVTGEVSVKMGYPFKPGATAMLNIAGQKFELFTKDEGAFVEKVDAEKGLIEALRKGGTMKIDGKSARGTATTDTYSLDGLKDALDRIAKDCSS